MLLDLKQDVLNAVVESKLLQAINCIYHPVEELHSAKCPHCGESYYMENYTTTTAMYFPLVYKNGVNINPDRNKSTTYCTCMNCGKDFSF